MPKPDEWISYKKVLYGSVSNFDCQLISGAYIAELVPNFDLSGLMKN